MNKVEVKGAQMSQYEYKVVPAPKTGLKAKGVKSSEERFANALETAMNALGAEGWEYHGADTLPCEARSGFTKRVTTFQNMLVFRRTIAVATSVDKPAEPALQAIAPVVSTPQVAAKPLTADPARPEPKVAAE